jgi:ATP-dependent helicase/nuclease subunit A
MEHGQNAVRVMTVHGAKGLQAPLVILPDTMQPPKPRGGLFWLDPEADGDELPLWPLRKGYDGDLVDRLRARAQSAQDQEYRRLLYVALTRAEDRLIVCGWRGKNAAPAGCWYNLVAAALADTAEAVDFDFTGEVENGWAGPGWRLRSAQTADAETDREESGAARAAAMPLPDWVRAPPPPEADPPRPLAPSRPSGAEPPVRSPLGPDEGRRFKRGRLVHRLLQGLPELAPAARAPAAARFLASPAHDLDAEERAEIQAVTLAVLDDPAFAALFGPGSRAEVPIVGLIDSGDGPQAVSGQVDRLVVDENSVLVVDYKTNRPAPAAEAGVAAVYLRQMAAYRTVLSKIYPDHRIDCALLWTDGPRLMQLSPVILDAQAS